MGQPIMKQQDIYLKVIHLMLHSKRHMAEIMEKRQMTPMQGMLLALFDARRGRSMQELSVLLGCDASNVTGLVDRLEAQGLVARMTDPTDRRVKLICLSDKGCKCRDSMLEALRQSEAADLQKLSRQEQADLVKIIDKLTSE